MNWKLVFAILCAVLAALLATLAVMSESDAKSAVLVFEIVGAVVLSLMSLHCVNDGLSSEYSIRGMINSVRRIEAAKPAVVLTSIEESYAAGLAGPSVELQIDDEEVLVVKPDLVSNFWDMVWHLQAGYVVEVRMRYRPLTDWLCGAIVVKVTRA